MLVFEPEIEQITHDKERSARLGDVPDELNQSFALLDLVSRTVQIKVNI
jgi:hypothetical protein